MTVVNDGAVGERLPSLYTRLVQTLSDADPRYAVIFVWAGPHAHANARSVGAVAVSVAYSQLWLGCCSARCRSRRSSERRRTADSAAREESGVSALF